jgi:hypothetical protein
VFIFLNISASPFIEKEYCFLWSGFKYTVGGIYKEINKGINRFRSCVTGEGSFYEKEGFLK